MDKSPLLIGGVFFREKGGTKGKPLVPPLCDYEQRIIFFTKEMIAPPRHCPETRKGVWLKLPQFDGHFKKYTIEVKGVSNEKKSIFYKRV